MGLITPAGLLYLGWAEFYDEIGHHKTHTTSDATSPSLPRHTLYDETQSEVDPTWHTFMTKYFIIKSASLDGHVPPTMTNFLSSMTKVYVIVRSAFCDNTSDSSQTLSSSSHHRKVNFRHKRAQRHSVTHIPRRTEFCHRLSKNHHRLPNWRFL